MKPSASRSHLTWHERAQSHARGMQEAREGSSQQQHRGWQLPGCAPLPCPRGAAGEGAGAGRMGRSLQSAVSEDRTRAGDSSLETTCRLTPAVQEKVQSALGKRLLSARLTPRCLCPFSSPRFWLIHARLPGFGLQIPFPLL